MQNKLIKTTLLLLFCLTMFSPAKADNDFYSIEGSTLIIHEGPTVLYSVDVNNIRENYTSVRLPSSLKKIGYRAFYNGTFTKITIPEGVIVIEDEAFSHCKKLETIVLPQSLTSIGKNCFEGCDSLIAISLPSSIQEIGDNAFRYCENLSNINIPTSLKEIGKDAFERCKKINKLICYDNGNRCLGWIGEYKPVEIIIPDGVTTIDDDAFSDCSATEITLSEGVKKIGNNAFSENLNSINIPQSVEFIGDRAIKRGTKVNNKSQILYYAHGTKCYGWLGDLDSCKKEIIIPDGVSYLNVEAFSWNSKIREVVIPESLKEISEFSFSKCANLRKVTLPKCGGIIRRNAFEDCSSMKELEITPNWELEEGAFDNCNLLNLMLVTDHGTVCRGLTNRNYSGRVVIPEGVKKIADKAFNECLYVKEFVLPEGLDSIGDMAFAECHNIEEFTMPNSVTYLGTHVFNHCYKMKNVHLSSSLTLIPTFLFADCSALESIEIPHSVKQISQSAFCRCTNLKSISIPDSVMEISNYTFSNCTSLEHVDWPSNLKYIDNYAFDNCPKLSHTDIPRGVKIGRDAFGKSIVTNIFESSLQIFWTFVYLLFVAAASFVLKQKKSYSWEKSIIIVVLISLGTAAIIAALGIAVLIYLLG